MRILCVFLPELDVLLDLLCPKLDPLQVLAPDVLLNMVGSVEMFVIHGPRSVVAANIAASCSILQLQQRVAHRSVLPKSRPNT